MAIAEVDEGGARITIKKFHRIGPVIVARSVQGKSLYCPSISIGRVKVKLRNRDLVVINSGEC
jgi:hypothetical protein